MSWGLLAEAPAPRLHVLHVPGADAERDRIVAELDGQADVCLHTDPTRRGVMPTWIEALACAVWRDDGLPWSMIIQDDAQPLPGWQRHLRDATTYAPSPVLGLTHFGGYGRKIVDAGVPYGIGDYLVWGGAIAYRRWVLPNLLDFARSTYRRTGYRHDDCLVGAYALGLGVRTAMCGRAVFGQPPLRSLLNHNTQIRSPSTTIEDPGPPWSAQPKSITVRRDVAEEIRQLARTYREERSTRAHQPMPG